MKVRYARHADTRSADSLANAVVRCFLEIEISLRARRRRGGRREKNERAKSVTEGEGEGDACKDAIVFFIPPPN